MYLCIKSVHIFLYLFVTGSNRPYIPVFQDFPCFLISQIHKVLSSVLFPLSPNGCECQCASRCQHQGKPQSEIGAVSRLWCVGAVSITVCCSRSRCFFVFISSEYPRPGECYIIRNNLFFNLVISFKIPCPAVYGNTGLTRLYCSDIFSSLINVFISRKEI